MTWDVYFALFGMGVMFGIVATLLGTYLLEGK